MHAPENLGNFNAPGAFLVIYYVLTTKFKATLMCLPSALETFTRRKSLPILPPTLVGNYPQFFLLYYMVTFTTAKSLGLIKGSGTLQMRTLN